MMRRLGVALVALFLLRADMYPDASNAKLPAAAENLGVAATLAGFGAKCDGVSDDAPAFAAAAAWMAGDAGRVVSLPAGVCATSQTVTVGNGEQFSTTLAAGAAASATSLNLVSAAGVHAGYGVVVKLDTGTYSGSVVGEPSGGAVTVSPALSGAAASGKAVYFGKLSYEGGGYRGAGSCQTAAEVAGPAAISTIRYTGAAVTTTLAAGAAAGAKGVTVASAAGLGIGTAIGVTLDSGAVWWSWVSETPVGGAVNIIGEIPTVAASGNAVIVGNAVVRVAGPMLGPVLEGVCLDGNGAAAVALDAVQPMGGKFQGPRGVAAINYTGVGFFVHAARTLALQATGAVNNDFEFYSLKPSNQKTIGCWYAGTPDVPANPDLKVGLSRNRMHGGNCKGGGNDVTAAGLRVEYIDNNLFLKPYTTRNGAGLGAGLYRMPSWQRPSFPQENTYLSPAFVGNVTEGTATGSATGVDAYLAFNISDGETAPTTNATGFTNTGAAIGLSRNAGYQALPSPPTGTVSATAVMMGLAGAITPNHSGTVRFDVVGTVFNGSTGGAFANIRYGTGTAPVNGAAATGTLCSGSPRLTSEVGIAGFKFPFAVSCTATGLAAGTAYWFDLGLAAITSGTANVQDLTVMAAEQ